MSFTHSKAKAMRVGSVVPLLLMFVSLLRVFIAGSPPKLDEQITLQFVHQFDTFELLWIIPSKQPHMPLFYVIADGIGIVTGNPADVRLISLAAGYLLPIAAFYWFQSIVSRWRAALAALFLASSPLLIVQSQWIRPYSLLSFAVLLTWWGAWRWVQDGSKWWFFAAASVSVALHPFGIVAVVASGAWIAWECHQDGHTLDQRLFFGGVSLAIAPAAAVVAGKLFGIDGFGSVAQLGHVSPAYNPGVRALVLPLTTLTGTLHIQSTILLVSVLSVYYILRAYRVRLWERQVGRLLIAWVVASMLILLTAQLVYPLLMLKYVAWMAPGVALSVAILTPANSRGVALVCTLLWVVSWGLVLGVGGYTVSREAIFGSGVLRLL